MRKPELLIPASSLEVLKTAVIFGADAVYIGGETFSLRAKAKNFSHEDMKEGIAFAHAHGVRVHVTANILAHNYDMEPARNYFQELAELAPDAIIVADPGMIMLANLGTGEPASGEGYELDAIAAVVLGGTSLSGGKGRIFGTIIGALIIGTLNNGLNILNVSSFYQQVVKGIVILLAVLMDRKKN